MNPPRLARDERMAVVGMTGMGKSYYCQYVFDQFDDGRTLRLAIDPKDGIRGTGLMPGANYCTRLQQIDFNKRDERGAPVPQVYVPQVFARDALIAELDRVYAYVWSISEADGSRPILVWLDECKGVTSPHKNAEHMTKYLVQGRVRNCAHLAASQRSVGIDVDVVGQADHVVAFPNGLKSRDVNLLADEMSTSPAGFNELTEGLHARWGGRFGNDHKGRDIGTRYSHLHHHEGVTYQCAPIPKA